MSKSIITQLSYAVVILSFWRSLLFKTLFHYMTVFHPFSYCLQFTYTTLQSLEIFFVSNCNLYALTICRQLLWLLETGTSTEQVLRPLIVLTLVIIHATILFSDEPNFTSRHNFNHLTHLGLFYSHLQFMFAIQLMIKDNKRKWLLKSANLISLFHDLVVLGK